MCIYTFNDHDDLLQEEKDMITQLSKVPLESLNLNAVSVVTKIYRVAQGLKNEMEREVLSKHSLSWTSFSILYDLWIHKSVETKKLAELNAVSKATISNITKTLEKKELCYRKTDPRDRRITYLTITDKGKDVIEELYPQFHQGEVKIVSSLSVDEQKSAAALLRRVIRDNQY